jgi:hypothetical protein
MNQDKQEERAENSMKLIDVGDVRGLTPQEEKMKEFIEMLKEIFQQKRNA